MRVFVNFIMRRILLDGEEQSRRALDGSVGFRLWTAAMLKWDVGKERESDRVRD